MLVPEGLMMFVLKEGFLLEQIFVFVGEVLDDFENMFHLNYVHSYSFPLYLYAVEAQIVDFFVLQFRYSVYHQIEKIYIATRMYII